MIEKLIESLVCERIQMPDGEKHFVTIEYQDGSEADFVVPGRCCAYLDTGFLIDADGKWLFYNTDGLKVAEREQEELGLSVEITSIGCYAFNKDPSTKSIRNVNFFYVDHSGKTIENPKQHPITGMPAEYEFSSDEEYEDLLPPRFENWTEVQNCFSMMRKNS